MAGGEEAAIYILADRLKQLPADIRAMPGRDYVAMCAYYEVKSVLDDLAHRTAVNRADS